MPVCIYSSSEERQVCIGSHRRLPNYTPIQHNTGLPSSGNMVLTQALKVDHLFMIMFTAKRSWTLQIEIPQIEPTWILILHVRDQCLFYIEICYLNVPKHWVLLNAPPAFCWEWGWNVLISYWRLWCHLTALGPDGRSSGERSWSAIVWEDSVTIAYFLIDKPAYIAKPLTF